MANVSFTCTKLVGTNKEGIITPDANGYYSATSTMSKLAGNYFADGIVGAVVEQTEEVSRIEEIIKV